jgi:hypothetical protein
MIFIFHMEFMHIFTLFLFIGDADKIKKIDQRDEKITEKMKDEKKCAKFEFEKY